MANFRVLREHVGDKPYKFGQLRKGDAADLKHLVDLGVLETVGPQGGKALALPGSKAARAPRNKRAAAPANKGG